MMPTVTQQQRLRQQGPMPTLSDSEALTMEAVVSYLGLSQDEALLTFFREYYTNFFPSLSRVHRSTFIRQAANLWSTKERHMDCQTFYGFRLHLRLGWSGVITHVFLAPANEANGEIAPVAMERTLGLVLVDRNYWLPDMQVSLSKTGIVLQTPFCKAHSPQTPAHQS